MMFPVFRTAWDSAADLLFPRSCVGCGAWDHYVCEACEAELSQEWRNVAESAPFLLEVSARDGSEHEIFPCFSVAHYSGVARQIIIAWKHSYSYGLDCRICEIWHRCIIELFSEHRCILGVADTKNVCIVPAPSRWRRRYEGQLVAGKLALEASRVCGYPMRDVLRVRSRLGDRRAGWKAKIQRMLGVDMKHQVSNRAQRGHKRHRIYARQRLDGLRVILVDDVVTTGATVAGAAWAIRQAGGDVLGVVAFASVSRNEKKC